MTNNSAATDANRQENAAKNFGGDITDVWWAIGAFIVIVGTLLIYVCQFAQAAVRGDLILVGAVCATVGWVLGILATPYNDHEATRLGRVAAFGYAALTGYVIGKLDRVVEDLIGGANGTPVETGFLPHIGVGTAMLLAAAVLTYVTRSYAWTSAKRAGRA